jgi:hypothetical protein
MFKCNFSNYNSKQEVLDYTLLNNNNFDCTPYSSIQSGGADESSNEESQPNYEEFINLVDGLFESKQQEEAFINNLLGGVLSDNQYYNLIRYGGNQEEQSQEEQPQEEQPQEEQQGGNAEEINVRKKLLIKVIASLLKDKNSCFGLNINCLRDRIMALNDEQQAKLLYELNRIEDQVSDSVSKPPVKAAPKAPAKPVSKLPVKPAAKAAPKAAAKAAINVNVNVKAAAKAVQKGGEDVEHKLRNIQNKLNQHINKLVDTGRMSESEAFRLVNEEEFTQSNEHEEYTNTYKFSVNSSRASNNQSLNELLNDLQM